jgi:hypothetical protein
MMFSAARYMKHKAHDQVKVKVKSSLFSTKHHAMKTYWRNGGITPHILKLGIRWKGHDHTVHNRTFLELQEVRYDMWNVFYPNVKLSLMRGTPLSKKGVCRPSHCSINTASDVDIMTYANLFTCCILTKVLNHIPLQIIRKKRMSPVALP